MDLKFKKYVINRVVTFPSILKYAGLNNYHYNSKVYCPFHANNNTPSAKIYHDETGDRLWCFAEQKMYKPSDVIEHDILNTTIDKVFRHLWDKLSPEYKKTLEESYGKVEYDLEWAKNPKLNLYKKGKCTLKEHLNFLIMLV